MLKLLVVEDHGLVREGLVRLLALVEEGTRVCESEDFESALTLLDNEGEFDLVLLDLALPGIDGFAGLDILRRRYPAMPVAVVSAFDDLPTITRVLNLGASGFIPKAYSGEELLSAVREILAGNIFKPVAQPGARLDDAIPVVPSKVSVRPEEVGLTDRQAQVLALMVRGLSNRDIAEQLQLSEGTVKIHVTAIFRALDVNSRTQALVAVARYGIDFESVF
ncbi:response regulator [Dechloromonas sp. TW-R-39-2]|uniref:response regulator n=1 Tax=Dechloromonas TaxID=73029 RepID=UPI00193D794C|nr:MULTISPECIES: response regulator transcription factor [Dechloromonas]QRM18531.1 response regulator [Dechloromonas sp. TW-R-39-2]UCV11962.1 response regulator transcription factor [Dechloromonas denitrificans]